MDLLDEELRPPRRNGDGEFLKPGSQDVMPALKLERDRGSIRFCVDGHFAGGIAGQCPGTALDSGTAYKVELRDPACGRLGQRIETAACDH
jgi:hypothetical protein